MKRRWSGANLTLRTKLTILLFGVLMVACAVVGVATGVVVDDFLKSRLDHDLVLAGTRYAVSLEHNDHDVDNRPETATVGQSAGTLGARLVDGVLTQVGVVSDSAIPVAVSPADRAAIVEVAGSGSTRTTVHFEGLGSYRLQLVRGSDGGVLVTGLPQASVDETLEVLSRTEFLVFSGVALVVGAIGGLAVRRSLRPLERVTATALRVSELPLASGEVAITERVPDGNPRTEVGRVASAVNHLLNQVEGALGARQASENRLRRFIADASHELRTPLAIVRSHAELIGLEAADFTESAGASLRSIDSGVQRMGRLVDDLLLLARLDSGVRLASTEVDLTRLVLEAVSDARVMADEHHWSLELPENPVLVQGDRERLEQVITNVLTNARVHTPPGTAISVTLSTKDVLRLDVVDDGPGIAAELLPRVQERFTSGQHSRSSGSSGLGLAIVAGVVQAHGGNLSIESQPGRTRVRINIPFIPGR